MINNIYIIFRLFTPFASPVEKQENFSFIFLHNKNVKYIGGLSYLNIKTSIKVMQDIKIIVAFSTVPFIKLLSFKAAKVKTPLLGLHILKF